MPLYRNFSTQEEIDREYSPRLAIGEDRANQYIARFPDESRRVRAAVPHMDEVPFGPAAAEHVDESILRDAEDTIGTMEVS